MKTFTNICAAVLLMMLFSCSSKPSESVISFKMDSIVDNIPETEIFTSLKQITLDTALVAVFRDAYRIAMHNGRIYILDRNPVASQLLMYDESGKFIKKIQTIGRGPREYIRVSEFYIDGNEVVLFANSPHKYIHYDLDLNFIKEDALSKQPVYNLAFDSSDDMIYGTLNGKDSSLCSWNKDDVAKVTESLPALPQVASVGLAQPMINNSKCILFTRKFDNNIYTVKDGKEQVKYTIDFGANNFPKAYLDRKFDMAEFFRVMEDENLVYGIFSAIETDRFLMFRTNLNNLCIYDKVDRTAINTRALGGNPSLSMIPINYADNTVAFINYYEQGASLRIATFIK